MGDLQELHDGRPVVADGHPPPVEDELVHPPGAEGRPDGVGHRLARVDVADQLGLALSVVERAQEEIRAGGRRTNKWGEYPDGTSKQRNTTTITPPTNHFQITAQSIQPTRTYLRGVGSLPEEDNPRSHHLFPWFCCRVRTGESGTKGLLRLLCCISRDTPSACCLAENYEK